MDVHDDPEFAGQVAVKALPPGKPGLMPDRLLVGWVGVYLANLVVPLILGLSATERGGRVGMALALPVWFGLGCWALVAWRRVGRALVIGGAVVAALQFMPVLQMFAGAFALGVVGAFKGSGPPSMSGEVAGFAATIISGGVLIGIALALGLPIRGIRSRGDFEGFGLGKSDG